MELLKIKPYELSIWKDQLKNVENTENNSYYEEALVAKIGSDQTSSPYEAFNIELIKNVNGEVKLSFSMIHTVFDEELGEKVQNPFIPYLVNERKVKLKYDDEWYDFIIKNVEENSSDNTFNYEATDLFVNELAKGGYNVVLSNELANNQGTITELAQSVVESTDWVIDTEGSEPIKQWVQEPVYLGTLQEDIRVINTDTNSEEPFASGTQIYFFYSTIATKQEKDIHILLYQDKEDGKWIYDDNNVAKGTNYRIINPVPMTYDTKGVPSIVNKIELQTFQAYRLGYGPLSKYDPVTEKYIDRYKVNGLDQEVYHYTDYEYTTSDILTNFFSNGNSFNVFSDGSIEGWSTTCEGENLPVVKVIPNNSATTRYGRGWLKLATGASGSLETDGIIYQLDKDFTEPNGGAVIHPAGTQFTWKGATSTTTSKYCQVGYTEDLLGGAQSALAELASNPTLDLSTMPSLAEVDNIRSYLRLYFPKKINEADYSNVIFNSGIQDQNEIVGFFTKGEKYILRMKYGVSAPYNKGDTPYITDNYRNTLRAVVAGYTVDENNKRKVDTSRIYFDFKASTANRNFNLITGGTFNNNYTTYTKTDGGLNTVMAPSTQFVYEDTNGALYKWDPTKAVEGGDEGQTGQFVPCYSSGTKHDTYVTGDQIMHYYYYIASCRQSLSREELANNDIGIFLYTTKDNSATDGCWYYWVEDIQLFKYREDSNGEPVMLGNIPNAASIPVDYYYLPQEKVIDGEKIKRYASLEDLAGELGVLETDITPIYNSDYDKVGSIEAEHSNYYNIIQDLCEKFQCWAKFKVEHDPNSGKLALDGNNKPIKKISFHEYVGKDNFAGFKYGINLDSIQRTFSSDEIVSKLIVAQNASDLVPGGLTIRRADANPLKESYLLNFSYYLNQGLVDKASFETDLSGYTKQLSELNTDIQNLDQEYADVTRKITKISGDRNTYTELLKAAQLNLTEAKETIRQVVGMDYDTFLQSGNGKIKITIDLSNPNRCPPVTVSKAISGLKIVDWNNKEIYPNPDSTARVIRDDSTKYFVRITSLPPGYTFPTYKKNGVWYYSNSDTKFKITDSSDPWWNQDLDEVTEGIYHTYLPLANEDNEGVIDTIGEILTDQTIINGYSGLVSQLNSEYNKLYTKAYGPHEYTITVKPYYTDNSYYVRTTDTAIISGKTYYRYNDITGQYDIVSNPNVDDIALYYEKVDSVDDGTLVTVDDFVDGITIRLNAEGSGVTTEFTSSTTEKIFTWNQKAVNCTFTLDSSFSSNQYKIYYNDTEITGDFPLTTNTLYTFKLKTKKKELQEESLEYQIDQKNKEKLEVEKKFYEKYSRFLQEGTWSSDDYVDNNLYYLDALQVSNTSAMPKTEYSIKVLEVSELEGLQGYKFDIGDKTTIEDTEFFGWTYKSGMKTPVREEVIVSEVKWKLDKPEENEITIKNYKTRFEDLFQRISATVQTVEYNKGSYMRAANMLDENGLIRSDLLATSMSGLGGGIISLSANGDVRATPDGIEATNTSQSGYKIRFGPQAISTTIDGGENWEDVLTPNGISVSKLTAGVIDTSEINIVDGEQTSFRWDKTGINAFSFDDEDNTKYDFSKFVRFDRFGLYGVEGIDGTSGFKPQSLKDIKDNASFGAVWDEFFIKNKYENGYVSMSSTNDFTVVRDNMKVVEIGNINDEGEVITTETTKYNPIDFVEVEGVLVPDFDPSETYYEYDSTLEEYVRVAEPTAADAENYYTKITETTTVTQPVYGIVIRDKSGNLMFEANSEGDVTLSGTLRSINYRPNLSGWQIAREGDAEFNSIQVRGSIHAAVFEYDEVQAIGGLVYIRPSTAITTAEVNGRNLILTVENPAIIATDNFCRISTELDNGITNAVYDYSYNNEIITITNYFPENIGEIDKLDELAHLVGAAFISLGNYNSTTRKTTNNFAISLNSSKSSFEMPAKAITLSEINRVDTGGSLTIDSNFRGIFGQLPANGVNVDSNIYQYMAETQGVYTDNIYIGDANKYIAFYTDTSTSPSTRKLAIKADLITFSGAESGTDLSDTIVKQEIQYARADGTTIPRNIDTSIGTDGWSTTMPTSTESYPYIWQRTYIKKISGIESYEPDSNGFYVETTEGQPGTSGYNTATIFLYQRSATTLNTPPTGGQTYTFNTGALSSVPTGWSTSIPPGNNPCYLTQTAVRSQGNTATIESWSNPIKLVEDGERGAEGTKIIGTFNRNSWTNTQWTSTYGIGQTISLSPNNTDSSGDTPPSWYDYNKVNVGDYIYVTGTATDTKIAYTNVCRVTTKPSTSTSDIPCQIIASNHSDRGEPGTPGTPGTPGPEASVEILVTNIDALSRTITLKAYLRTVATVSSRTYQWYKNGDAVVEGTSDTLQISGDDLNATYECEIEWS